MGDRAGQQLGNYRLLSLLGQGGFAEVYLGEHVFLKKAVAVKVLYTQLGKNDLEGFLKEAQTIAHLEHPHIVRVTDFGLDGDLPYLVMEYAPNGTLRQRHPRDSTLPFATISAYVKQVAAALQYAHDEKLVHRDIKPENMLLNRNDELLLSDFGVATVAHRTATQNTQSIAGTAVYMAPELFRGKSYAASDQYALGIVVYEWLTGQPPFNKGDFIQLGFHHTYVPPDPLSEKNSAIPKDVEQVVMTALAKDPKQRFGSVKAFANALEQACMGAAATQKEEAAEAAPPPVLSVQAKEVTQPPGVQSQSAPLSLEPASVVQEIPPFQPALTPNQDTPPTSTPVVSMQIAASDNQLQSQNQSIPSLSVPSVSMGAMIYQQQPLVAEYIPPLSTSVNSKRNSSQQAKAMPVEGILSALAQPKRTVSRRSVIIGLGIAGLVAVGGGITWLVISQKPAGFLYLYHGHSQTRTPSTPATSSSATATPATQTGSLPTPRGFLTATSTEVGISMQYPSDWLEDAPNVTTSGNTAIGFHPPQQLQTAISIGRLSATNSTSVTSTDEVNQANLQGFGSANSLTNPQLGTASQPTTIGGVSWDELDATYSDSTGATVHVSSISVKYKSIYYNVLFFAPSAVYAEAVQKYYSQMLGSFKFTA